MPCVKQEGHRLRHRALGEAKRLMVRSIAAAPRGSPERSILFQRMRQDLADASASHPALRDWRQRLRDTIEQEQSERLLFDRELFYAVQPADRLAGVIERVRGLFE